MPCFTLKEIRGYRGKPSEAGRQTGLETIAGISEGKQYQLTPVRGPNTTGLVSTTTESFT